MLIFLIVCLESNNTELSFLASLHLSLRKQQSKVNRVFSKNLNKYNFCYSTAAHGEDSWVNPICDIQVLVYNIF